jgi:drug/metabolite transporter (DMT)-like permease
VAVGDFNPLFLTAGRAAIAALLGIALLVLFRQPRSERRHLGSLAIVALGVAGLPLLTALTLQHITAARSIVFLGLLPMATALFGVLRGGECPRPAFWFFSGMGSLLVGFALLRSSGSSFAGDLLMAAAIAACGPGYAEGATLSRRLGGWQVISWALILSLPFMGGLALWTLPLDWSSIGVPAWIGFVYVSLFSMLLGFVFWYRGLALGGIAAVGQLQLLQPFFGLLLAGALLGEPVPRPMIAVTAASSAASRARKGSPSPPPNRELAMLRAMTLGTLRSDPADECRLSTVSGATPIQSPADCFRSVPE